VVVGRVLTLALDTGFKADDGATLLMAFRGIQAETTKQGGVHKSIARELHHLVADPFESWSKGYHVRLSLSSFTLFFNSRPSIGEASGQ